MENRMGKFLLATALLVPLLLAACVFEPYGGDRGNGGYGYHEGGRGDGDRGEGGRGEGERHFR